MRVVVEKACRGPGHALTVREVRALVGAAEVVLGPFPGMVVHLKATLPGTTGFDRPVIYAAGTNRLNVPKAWPEITGAFEGGCIPPAALVRNRTTIKVARLRPSASDRAHPRSRC